MQNLSNSELFWQVRLFNLFFIFSLIQEIEKKDPNILYSIFEYFYDIKIYSTPQHNNNF